MFGAMLALASAAFFGLNNATLRRGVLTATVLQGMAITVTLGVPIFLVMSLVFGGFQAMAAMGLPSYMWFAAAGVVHFVIGRYGNYRATQALGATLSTPVQQLSILISLVLALVFLGEEMTGLKLIGLVLVLVGPAFVLGRRKASAKAAKTKLFEPKYTEGFFWGAVCALGYGVSPLFIALALGPAGTIADSVAGVTISYVVAAVVVVIWVMIAGGRAYMRGIGGAATGWFLASTLFVALSQLFRYMALAVAPVSVVVPIQRLSVVFRLIFGALLNRDSEILDAVVIGGILLSVAGAVALSIDTAIARDWLAMPEGLAALLFTRWDLGF